MDKFVVNGGNTLSGTMVVSGAKNVALKALVAASLTEEEVVIHNVPLIADFFVMVDILKALGAQVTIEDHTVRIQAKTLHATDIPLDMAAKARTSAMFLGPLLARRKEAIIPNPGGCRLGARPIDRIIDGITQMNAQIVYHSEDGYFHAKTEGLKGITYTFEKNTHTGTETLLIAAVLAAGTTILENAAQEPEIDELIILLQSMGAKIHRSGERQITIHGVETLHGATYAIKPDRNEIVTFAIAAIITKGDIFIKDAQLADLDAFLLLLDQAKAGYEKKSDGVRFFYKGELLATDVTTAIYPGFMTDWQAPWAVLMTQAHGVSLVHETVFENKLGYTADLKRMGAKVALFNPEVASPETVYNFNLADNSPEFFHAVRITGPTPLHNAIVKSLDIRAGAAVVLAALVAKGETTIHGAYLIDRGYEKFEQRLSNLGANIKRVSDTI
ncbi:MAG: UDP-N-acetylglucosamine 1-carboxyvinyltransferase [Candidatus Levybacteria bacterium]|nr:UDP-N-acetylglucosamine 1-carboxyvinyltransferase [Candidatus Levybacteria bacterium]